MAGPKEYPYLALFSKKRAASGAPDPLNGALFPAIRVRLVGRDGLELRTRAVIDSGASCSCFPLAFADQLGIDLSKCKETPATTAGGPGFHYEWDGSLTAYVARRKLALRAVFAPTKVALLGRSDFFTQYLISFDQQARTFTLESAPKRRA